MTPECVSKMNTLGVVVYSPDSWWTLIPRLDSFRSIFYLITVSKSFSTFSCLSHISAIQNTTTPTITNLCRVCKHNVVLLCSVRTGWWFDSSEFLYLGGSHSPLCPCPGLHFWRWEDNVNKKQNKCCCRSASSVFVPPTKVSHFSVVCSSTAAFH